MIIVDRDYYKKRQSGKSTAEDAIQRECTPHALNVLERFFQEKNVSPVTTVDILSTEGNPEAVGEVYKESDEERMDEGDGESKRVFPEESKDVSRKRRLYLCVGCFSLNK